MLKPLNANELPRQQVENDISAPDVLSFFETVFRNDIRFKIIVLLSNREGALLREIARNTGISHKNLSKYLDALTQKGILDVYPVGMRNRVYKLAPKYSYLKQFL